MAVNFVFIVVVLILSVIVHEVSHGYMADHLGDPTARLAGRLTLNPLPHIDLFGSILVPALTWFTGGFIFGWAKPVPYNPYNLGGSRFAEAKVAVAGPASNIILALLAGVAVRLTGASGALLDILSIIVMVNIVLALFNLIPIPPLDGSKIFFAFLPHQSERVLSVLERYGLFFVLLFVFFLWRFVAPLVGVLFELLTGTPL